jgi:hypothetical protein
MGFELLLNELLPANEIEDGFVQLLAVLGALLQNRLKLRRVVGLLGLLRRGEKARRPDGRQDKRKDTESVSPHALASLPRPSEIVSLRKRSCQERAGAVQYATSVSTVKNL